MMGFDGILGRCHSRAMLSREFLSGQYQKTISQFLGAGRTLSSNEIVSLIGALCFSGKLFEARETFKSSKELLDEQEKAASRFFIGLALTRRSSYQKASKLFAHNLKALTKNSSDLQRFYVYQGIAFYLFFIGKLGVSKKWAYKSSSSAIASGDLYARSLSTDLLGHLKIRLGEINGGHELLEEAASFAKKIGNSSVGDAIEISSLQYQAQYGFEREIVVSKLEKKLAQFVSEDNYSRAAIGLELARQYTLRGQFDQSERVLESISPSIFASENRRQEILLNLRYAENFFQMGKKSLAWNYLRSARRCLDFEADKSFEVQILGFEYKLFEENSRIQVKETLLTHSRSYSSLINYNILNREGLIEGSYHSGEDAFHNFILSLESDVDPIEKIINSGYWSLLPKFMSTERGKNQLSFDVIQNRLIYFFENKIHVETRKLTKTDIKILQSLINGTKTRASLCQQVWGYTYDPIRHDTVIHTAIRSLRKNMGPGSVWIETHENGYQISSSVKTHLLTLNVTKKAQEDSTPDRIKQNDQDLNLRQIKALQILKKQEALDVANYRKIFNVTEVTASRDLRGLKKNGFVVSIGKARAIKYVLADKE